MSIDHETFDNTELIDYLNATSGYHWYRNQDGVIHKYTDAGLKLSLNKLIDIHYGEYSADEIVESITEEFLDDHSNTTTDYELICELTSELLALYTANQKEDNTHIDIQCNRTDIEAVLTTLETYTDVYCIRDIETGNNLVLSTTTLTHRLSSYFTLSEAEERYYMGDKAKMAAERYYHENFKGPQVRLRPFITKANLYLTSLDGIEGKILAKYDCVKGQCVAVKVGDFDGSKSVHVGRNLTKAEIKIASQNGLCIDTSLFDNIVDILEVQSDSDDEENMPEIPIMPEVPIIEEDNVSTLNKVKELMPKVPSKGVKYYLTEAPGQTIHDVLETLEQTKGPSVTDIDYWVYHRDNKYYMGLNKEELRELNYKFSTIIDFYKIYKVGPVTELALHEII